MRIKACVDFYGNITMKKSEIWEVENTPVISDLLKIGLIEIVDEGGEKDESERS